MKQLKYRFIPEGQLYSIYFPISVALIDYKDVQACGIGTREACERVAATIPGAAGITVFDMDATTTNSDGVMFDGSMVCMAASDYGKINKDFGYLDMVEVPWSQELMEAEPHLKQWKINYPDRRLLMGPDPKKKNIPIHNCVITGRAGNNNSATEMMNYITMEEILLPIIGQLEMMRDGQVEIGKVGHVISVGIGMVVPEKYGRIVPNRQFRCGDTAHHSKEYAQTLKCDLPCVVADKSVLARYILKALQAGMIPGRDIGPSPAVLSVARHMGIETDYENITEASYIELASVGFTKEWMKQKVEPLTPEEIIARAHEIIPGVENAQRMNASALTTVKYI
jgi:hypothetical protein